VAGKTYSKANSPPEFAIDLLSLKVITV